MNTAPRRALLLAALAAVRIERWHSVYELPVLSPSLNLTRPIVFAAWGVPLIPSRLTAAGDDIGPHRVLRRRDPHRDLRTQLLQLAPKEGDALLEDAVVLPSRLRSP